MKIVIFKGKNSQYYYHIKAGNGRIVADGAEGYTLQKDAYRAARKLVHNIRTTTVRIVNTGGKYDGVIQFSYRIKKIKPVLKS